MNNKYIALLKSVGEHMPLLVDEVQALIAERDELARKVALLTKIDVDDGIREALASYSHDAWSQWMRYMFSICASDCDGVLIEQRLAEKILATLRAALTHTIPFS